MVQSPAVTMECDIGGKPGIQGIYNKIQSTELLGKEKEDGTNIY